jgi:hypothetical protein
MCSIMVDRPREMPPMMVVAEPVSEACSAYLLDELVIVSEV